MTTEYLIYATGSAEPLANTHMTFFVTADPKPMVIWYILGVISGFIITAGYALINSYLSPTPPKTEDLQVKS